MTVITATYNAAALLPTTIDSIRSQSYENFEWIVIDGGSTDGTIDLLRQNEDVITLWTSEPDLGVYDAWNKAIRKSRGEWVSFLGSGDRYCHDALQNYVDYVGIDQNKELDYVSSSVEYRYGSKARTRTIGKPWNWGAFRKYMCVAHVGSFHNRKLFDRYGLFDIGYRITGDYELLLRPKEHLRAGYIPDVTAIMISGGVSVAGRMVFIETCRAKVATAARNRCMAGFEMFSAYFKFTVKRILGLI